MNKLISIIVPVYNVEKYLKKCVESILEQTYRNFELILVDDGSIDNCGKICDDLAIKESRIKVIHKINKGVSEARNDGLSIASGDYVIFLDPDDYIGKDMLYDMVLNLEKYNVDMVCCGYRTIFPDKVIEHNLQDEILYGKKIPEKLYDLNFFPVVWNKLFKKNVLFKDESFIKFNSELYIGEDLLWLANVLKNCKKIYCMGKIYYNWFRRENSAVGLNENRIDFKALTEIRAKKLVCEVFKDIDSTYELAVKSHFSSVVTKIKIADINKNVEAWDFLKLELEFDIREYPIKNIKDLLKILKWKMVLIAKNIGISRKIIIMLEGKL